MIESVKYLKKIVGKLMRRSCLHGLSPLSKDGLDDIIEAIMEMLHAPLLDHIKAFEPRDEVAQCRGSLMHELLYQVS